jgi:hypothetical protein
MRTGASKARPVLIDEERALAVVAAPDEMDRGVESWQVAAASQRLTPGDREVQVHWMGCSGAETAVALGIPAGTVKSRSYYAVRALRLALEEMGGRMTEHAELKRSLGSYLMGALDSAEWWRCTCAPASPVGKSWRRTPVCWR